MNSKSKPFYAEPRKSRVASRRAAGYYITQLSLQLFLHICTPKITVKGGVGAVGVFVELLSWLAGDFYLTLSAFA